MVAQDSSNCKTVDEKVNYLREAPLQVLKQSTQLQNPDTRIILTKSHTTTLLEQFAYAYKGITTGDDPWLRREFWEMPSILPGWIHLQSTLNPTKDFGGRESILWFDALNRPTHKGSYIRGRGTAPLTGEKGGKA